MNSVFLDRKENLLDKQEVVWVWKAWHMGESEEGEKEERGEC